LGLRNGGFDEEFDSFFGRDPFFNSKNNNRSKNNALANRFDDGDDGDDFFMGNPFK
jgi:hypothetical protein